MGVTVATVLHEDQIQPGDEPSVLSQNQSKQHPPGFYDFPGLCALVPLSPRTLRNLIHQGLIPHIRMKGGRRLLFHGPSVERALLRFQKGGIPD